MKKFDFLRNKGGACGLAYIYTKEIEKQFSHDLFVKVEDQLYPSGDEKNTHNSLKNIGKTIQDRFHQDVCICQRSLIMLENLPRGPMLI